MDQHNHVPVIENRRNILTAVICICALGLNLILGYFSMAMKLPLYLDTIGTIIVAVLGGYLPAVLVGFATNLLKTIWDSTALYYSMINVMVAVIVAWMARYGWTKKFVRVLAMVCIVTLIAGGLGSLIPWFMDDLVFDGASLSGAIYGTGYFTRFASHVIVNVLLDFPDKAISFLVALTFVHFLPIRYHKYFLFNWWMQRPLEDADSVTPDKSSIRLISLRNKMLLVFGLALTLVAFVGLAISLMIYHKTIIKDHTRTAQNTAQIAASVLDGDEIDKFLNTLGETEMYRSTQKTLSNILTSANDVSNLHVYRVKSDNTYVVFDINAKGLPGKRKGSSTDQSSAAISQLTQLNAGREIEPVITNDKTGYLVTAYQPVFDSKGRCVCYLGVEADLSNTKSMERNFLIETISVFFGFFILLCVVVIWMTEYHIVIPVHAITKYVDELSDAVNVQETMDADVRAFRTIDIHTGDEIELLYKSIGSMLLNQAEQMRSIRRLSNTTALMQEGLIITMADLVENRDSDTGAHIQKTSAYVKIIVESLKRNGHYAEKITPQFMSDVVRSAPLHDIEKINISDTILNKPGKLTDEEFEIMKTHTTAGCKIMEKAINTIGGENYLKEARNMAAYHHERWDGRGYPDGLHGEVIPLSARIMAVADVFDALTSPRVYKPAFSLEKALEMLKEGSGTQFDPKCVEAFIDSLPEIKVILKKYNEVV